MKKTIIFILVLFIALTSLSATFSDTSTTDLFRNTKPFLTSREYRIEHGLFENPATLAGGKFQISIPVSVTAYNAGKNLQGISASSVKNMALEYAKNMIANIPSGDSVLANANAGFFLGVKDFAFGLYASVDADARRAKNNDVTVTPVADAGLAIGYARRVIDSNVTLDLGLSAHADVSAFWDYKINSSDLENFKFSKAIFTSITDIYGYASVDAGATVGFFDGKLKLNIAANNIVIGGYHRYDTSSKKFEKVSKDKFEDPFELSAGALFTLEGQIAKLGLSADIVDILGFDFKNFKAKDILGHLDLRATASLWKAFKVSAALCEGDLELGAGINVYGNEIDAVFKVVEMTETLGQKPSGTLTLKCRIGFDNN